jgi:hypothetical protein
MAQAICDLFAGRGPAFLGGKCFSHCFALYTIRLELGS